MRSVVITVIIFLLFLLSINIDYCGSETCSTGSNDDAEYYIVSRSYTSNQIILTRKHVQTSSECKEMARRKNGMAFSFKFVPNLKSKIGSNFTMPRLKKSSCIVYECPEVENSTSLIENKGYDYYSIYADPIPPQNATCIPDLGVFVLHTINVNYTTAKSRCEEYGSTLPDVATARRTNSIAKMLDDLFEKGTLKEAYVGLENSDQTDFIRSTGDKLTCSTFRAWAPGHPRKLNETCGLLTSTRMWKTVDCKTEKPFICEIYPGGWYLNYEVYDNIPTSPATDKKT